MAQKKKVTTKSLSKSKPNSRPAVTAKPAKKIERSTAKASKKPTKVKMAAKPIAKSKTPAKTPSPPAKVLKTATKAVPKSAPKAADKKPVASAVPPAAKPAVKPAAKAAPAAAKAASPAPAKAAGASPVHAAAPAKAAAPAGAAKAPEASKPAVAQAAVPGVGQAARPAGTPPGKVGVPPFRSGPVQFGVSHSAARTVPSALPKPAMRSFPATGAPVAGSTAPASPRDIAQKAVDARQQQVAGALAGGPKKVVTARHGFKINESIVYPAHGVGRIIGIEEQEIAGMPLELFVIQFEKDKMTLKVPTGKLETVGMRKLAEDGIVTKAMETLKGRARVKRTMWSRRAQEYEAKINSGDLISIAEVVRDLYRSESQPEQSYSERQLYEAALDRMAREIAAVARMDERGAVQRITEVLAKSAKGRRALETAEPVEAEVASDAKAA